MGKVFDEADYNRRLDQAANMSTGQELKLIVTGGLDAKKAMNDAAQNALIKARKHMMKAIADEEQAMRDRRLIPIDVEEFATGAKGDELVKVQ
jgi:hypothetical protein